jgi:PEP-CTERM motif
MSRSRMLRFAAISWLPLFSMVAGAQAQIPQVYNVASDWLSTYATSTALKSATSATWGPTATTHVGWSAGSMSSNWSNSPIVLSPTFSSATQNGVGYNTLATYYNASTGYLTSGTASATYSNQQNVATYTYTVPFQTYQLNPGATINMNMGITTTEQVASAFTASAGEKVTLPTSWTNTGAGTGVVQGIGAVESIPSAGTTAGFTTTAFNIQKSFSDGQNGNTVPDTVPGVFYNYGVDGSSKFDPLFSVASSGTDNVVTLNGSLGPSYVAWTAPAGGFATISATFWDTSWSASDNDGSPSAFVFDTHQLGANGPTSFLMSALDLSNVGNGNPVGGRGDINTWVTGGTLVSQLDSTYSAANGALQGVNYAVNQMYVSAGETIYFVVDGTRTDGGQHSFEGGQDMVALRNSITFVTPEPSSFVLLGMAGVGLALTAWRRRRSA